MKRIILIALCVLTVLLPGMVDLAPDIDQAVSVHIPKLLERPGRQMSVAPFCYGLYINVRPSYFLLKNRLI